MEHSQQASSDSFATVPQSETFLPTDAEVVVAQGGVAIATILSITLLVKWLVRLIEVSKADG
jgi:hypothetical protein